MVTPYATPTACLLAIGFLLTAWLMILRPWLKARREGMVLRFPVVSWLLDCYRRDMAGLNARLDAVERQVACNRQANVQPGPLAALTTPLVPASKPAKTITLTSANLRRVYTGGLPHKLASKQAEQAAKPAPTKSPRWGSPSAN